MPVDNQMYDRLSHTWWEDDGFLNILKSGLNPSRFGYMRRILTDDLGHDPKGLRILEIDYREATGDALPFADGEFPAAYCCDVLEHVDDVGRTVAEIARVLEPGGVFLYDTVNRTLRSKLLMIKLSQDWSATAWAEPDLHEFDRFIRPDELEAHLERAGLEVRDRVGFAAANPPAAVKAMWDRRHGKITYREMGERLGIKESRDTSSSYGGYALKRRPAA
jgi:2-polyprenyl-6-hydroxyphenyl methylase/3-demethylubiquinone-9 3-methyltransferase